MWRGVFCSQGFNFGSTVISGFGVLGGIAKNPGFTIASLHRKHKKPLQSCSHLQSMRAEYQGRAELYYLNQSEFPGPPRWLMTVTVRVSQGPGPADSESELEVLKYYLPLARASVSRASQVTVSVPGNLKNVPVPLSARARGSEPCAGAVVTVRRPPAAGRRLRSGSECESVNGRLSTPPGPADHSHGPRPAGARARARPRAPQARRPGGGAARRRLRGRHPAGV